MQNLLKFFLLTLISLTTLNAINLNSISDQTFSSNRYSGFINPAFNASSVQAKFINSKYLRIGNDIYSLSSPSEIVFNTSIKKDIGFFLNTPSNDLYYHNSNFETIKIPCQFSGDSILACARSYASITNGSVKEVEFSYYQKFNISKVTECQPDENFNTETKQCQKCPEGKSWDSENNRCYDDCSDVNKNMWGFTDGSCINCSEETTDDGVSQCYCKGIGSSYKTSHVTVCPDGGSICITSCDDGSQFNFKKPNTPDIPKPDPNAPDTPGGPGNQNPNNPGGPGGGNGGPGGDNGGSGGNQGGGNSGGGPGGQDNQGGDTGGSGGGNNGNNQGGGNSGGGSGGSGSGNGKDKDAKFNADDFKYGDIEDMFKDMKNKLERAVTDNESKFIHFEDGIKQFIQNVQGNGLSSFSKSSAPNSCPKTYNIPIGAKSAQISFDLCKILEPVRPVVYYIVYISTFSASLFLVIKLMIFSF